MRDYLVTMTLQIPLRVPVRAANEQHAADVAMRRLEEGVPTEALRVAVEAEAHKANILQIAEPREQLPAMELPIEYEAPHVR